MSNRDEFSPKVREEIAKRPGVRCSCPGCTRPTSGPQDDPNKSVNVGVAAHMAAASPGGPRYDPSMSPEQRMSAENGIWLCQVCGKLVDNDVIRFPIEKLHDWKRRAEERARRGVEGGPDPDEPGAILVRVSNSSFRFMGKDQSGGQARSKRERALWIQCWVPAKFFNPRVRNVGLMDIRLVFLKEGAELLEVVPGEYTGRGVHGGAYWPDTDTLTLPTCEWLDITFARNLWKEQMAAAADCDEILLTASTVEGEALSIKVASGIVDKDGW
jgi:hypothetical protein